MLLNHDNNDIFMVDHFFFYHRTFTENLQRNISCFTFRPDLIIILVYNVNDYQWIKAF